MARQDKSYNFCYITLHSFVMNDGREIAFVALVWISSWVYPYDSSCRRESISSTMRLLRTIAEERVTRILVSAGVVRRAAPTVFCVSTNAAPPSG
jgi:hypothetical protein